MSENYSKEQLQRFLEIQSDRADNLAQEIYTYKSADNKQVKVEFNRYKQDCRKRALEMAQANQRVGYNPNPLPSLQQFSNTINTEAVLRDADKYYNWLISIPNE